MVTLKLSDEQVIELFKQLDPEVKLAALNSLFPQGDLWWQITLAQGEEQLRRLASEHSLDWDTMSETEREGFVDDLLHAA
jgi:hypothetical protein